MINLITVCRNRYSIPFQDLADAAETNRVHLIITSILLFAFAFIDLIILAILQLTRGGQKAASFIYWGIFTVLSIYTLIHSLCVRNVPRKKAYLLKTFPFYVVLAGSIFATVFNFYILDQPFNGVLIFSIVGMLSLRVFNFSLPPYVFIVCSGYICLIPGVYKNFGLTGLLDLILTANLMCGLGLYKRHLEKRFLVLLQHQKKNLVAKTFGNFTLLYDNKVIKFSRSKSPELLAYLIYKNGSSVNTKELLNVLYGSHADSARYGASLRNLIVDIRQALSDLEIQKFFITEYNNFRINPEVVQCDYYDFLEGNVRAIKAFAGEFMSQYDWAQEGVDFLKKKVIK